jgi:anti-sigma factor RsiW
MGSESVHDLTAAYALDALDPGEQRAYEQHLAACEACRAELARLQEAAGALAYGAPAPPPPAALRERILDAAAGERAVVVPLRRRRPFQAAVATAGLAAAAALALAVWAASLEDALDRARADERSAAAALALAADPAARRFPVDAGGTLVVAQDGRAALVLDGLDEPPEGKAYEAWVIAGELPEPAGLFDGEALVLDRTVPEGATVAVTLEDDEGAAQPTGAPVAVARAE